MSRHCSEKLCMRKVERVCSQCGGRGKRMNLRRIQSGARGNLEKEPRCTPHDDGEYQSVAISGSGETRFPPVRGGSFQTTAESGRSREPCFRRGNALRFEPVQRKTMTTPQPRRRDPCDSDSRVEVAATRGGSFGFDVTQTRPRERELARSDYPAEPRFDRTRRSFEENGQLALNQL